MATEVIPHRSQVLGLWSSQCFPKCWHPGTRSVGAETISQDSSHPQLDKPEKIPSRLLGPLFQHQRYSNPPTLVQRFWIFHSTPRSSFPSGSQDLSTHSLKGNPLRLVFGGGGGTLRSCGDPEEGEVGESTEGTNPGHAPGKVRGLLLEGRRNHPRTRLCKHHPFKSDVLLAPRTASWRTDASTGPINRPRSEWVLFTGSAP